MIKLLHVEDDADIREIALMALEMSGEFEVLQCNSGNDALEKVSEFAPDVFLLDMMMPGMTGRETLDQMRKDPALSAVPAIFMTARAQHSEIEELLANGAADVISKPFDPMALSEQIKQAIEKSIQRT
ncbi:response regulator [Sulfitobacter guttiformis]|uniref:Response regulator receiver domain-containing protein n=1 Tax=Sulfitobacter guttiformis TaxID=74349 RepID=A0A420DTT6_9RHOB|nr:response regulator [Sulfitobacter guttiformis]KIN71076.1 Response regulator receiver domain protein [Sulfitobacter guttiformis KCTC 32187]RKE97559.1 response regulator receiver domain-containing protein [Sulfitobacter guttiformis]